MVESRAMLDWPKHHETLCFGSLAPDKVSYQLKRAFRKGVGPTNTGSNVRPVLSAKQT